MQTHIPKYLLMLYEMYVHIFYLGCIQAAARTTNKTQSIQQMSSAKLTVRSMLSKVKVSNYF